MIRGPAGRPGFELRLVARHLLPVAVCLVHYAALVLIPHHRCIAMFAVVKQQESTVV
jgi:hypothetical protein